MRYRVVQMAVSDADFRAAMASFASGVTIITTVDSDGVPFGLTATAFCSVSRKPALCLVSVGHAAEALPALRAARRFAVHLLARPQEELSARFATHGLDKFDGVSWARGAATGCPLLGGALVSLECKVTESLVAGDHDVFVGEVLAANFGDASAEPLVYFRGAYRDLVQR